MKTALLISDDVPDFDAQILDKLPLKLGTEKGIKAERMQIGIRNQKGDIYRAIGITGLGQFLDAIEELAGIGLVDELEHKSGPSKGYDAIFR